MMCHIVSECQREKLCERLHSYRQKLVNEIQVPSLLNAEILTGLSNSLIDSIVSNVNYIGSIDDLLSEYIFDSRLASAVMDIIDSTLNE